MTCNMTAALSQSHSNKRDVMPMPLLHRKILAHLSGKATDARGYATLALAGYNAAELDEAIDCLHHSGLINAFFIARAAQPQFQPSSLTPEGRRVLDRAARASAA